MLLSGERTVGSGARSAALQRTYLLGIVIGQQTRCYLWVLLFCLFVCLFRDIGSRSLELAKMIQENLFLS